MFIAKPLLLPKQKCSKRSFRKRTSINNQQYHEISGVENFRKSLALSGISKAAFQLIAGARRESSTASYESTWRGWVGWCSGKQINPCQCNINPIL